MQKMYCSESCADFDVTQDMHAYEVRPRSDKRGVDLISNALPFGSLWYGEPDALTNAIGYAKVFSRSNDVVIRVYDDACNAIECARRRIYCRCQARQE